MMLRNKIRYLLLLSCSGLLLILYNKYYIGIIFLTILVMPFFLFGLLCYIYGNIRAELVGTTHVANKEEQIPVTVQLTNPTIFPVPLIKLYLSYQNTYSGIKHKKMICASLDYRTKTSVVLNISSQYAGNIDVTLEGFRIFDYMKLFSLKQKLNTKIRAAVLPAYYEIENYPGCSRYSEHPESEHYSLVRKGDDPSEVFEIREYREGDRLQRIHWKLSRKQNQLMIKEFSEPVNCSALLFVNLNIPAGDNILSIMDAILECTLSLSYTFLLRGQIHYLCWYDMEHGECRRLCVSQEKDLFEAVDGLLHSKPYTENREELTVYLAQYPQDHYSDLFFISPTVSEHIIDSFTAIKADNRQMIYMNKPERPVNIQLQQRYKETGVDLRLVDTDNIRNGMEQLSLG